jgi:hypothetical protein
MASSLCGDWDGTAVGPLAGICALPYLRHVRIAAAQAICGIVRL